jgi:hypothetical protein
LVLTKNGLGYSLGDFFTNSSGHSDGKKSNKMKNDLRTRKQIKRKRSKKNCTLAAICKIRGVGILLRLGIKVKK